MTSPTSTSTRRERRSTRSSCSSAGTGAATRAARSAAPRSTARSPGRLDERGALDLVAPGRAPLRGERARAPRGLQLGRVEPERGAVRRRAGARRTDRARALPRPDVLLAGRAGGRARGPGGVRARRHRRSSARRGRRTPPFGSARGTAPSGRRSSRRSEGPVVPASCGVDPEPQRRSQRARALISRLRRRASGPS